MIFCLIITRRCFFKMSIRCIHIMWLLYYKIENFLIKFILRENAYVREVIFFLWNLNEKLNIQIEVIMKDHTVMVISIQLSIQYTMNILIMLDFLGTSLNFFCFIMRMPLILRLRKNDERSQLKNSEKKAHQQSRNLFFMH